MAKRVDRFSQIVLGFFTKIFGARLQGQVVTSRSAPCPCGSGLKYKRCCLPKEIEKGRRAPRSRNDADKG